MKGIKLNIQSYAVIAMLGAECYSARASVVVFILGAVNAGMKCNSYPQKLSTGY